MIIYSFIIFVLLTLVINLIGKKVLYKNSENPSAKMNHLYGTLLLIIVVLVVGNNIISNRYNFFDFYPIFTILPVGIYLLKNN
ncbi:unnamed protein product [Fructobacillus tropaeoli]|uniref:Uncharacterized protein n=1 Tax=Fructobacillus tropaeoli TaxID=709323 RepID=A0A3F3GZ62_9LACO|nr:hypothetical protein FTRO_0013330 [Fructobacillus tropaeoli]CAK1230185.1 unnamed protein product [Fructobacillus tropaeoli]CAK1231518.1 unnamed protein product [Fructobacillus tropaeoli]